VVKDTQINQRLCEERRGRWCLVARTSEFKQERGNRRRGQVRWWWWRGLHSCRCARWRWPIDPHVHNNIPISLSLTHTHTKPPPAPCEPCQWQVVPNYSQAPSPSPAVATKAPPSFSPFSSQSGDASLAARPHE
jgi:hypothetical protein